MSFMKKYLLEIVVFVSGALVMIYEIIGSRILAPYIGTSTYVWTSLIGVILASLSLGYWLGGKMADEKPRLSFLAGIFFLASALLSLTILLHSFVLTFISTSSLNLELKSIFSALILFAPASVLFGFVTPYAVKLKILSLESAGKTVGRLYALSTVGSILGTFSAGFFLLPFVGSIRTLYLLAGLSLLLSLLIAPFKINTNNLFVVLLFPLTLVFNEVSAFNQFKSIELKEFDTEYNHLRVFRGVDKRTNQPIRVLTTDPISAQSAMFLDSDELVFDYAKYYHLHRFFKPDFSHSLIIGGAGYSFPKSYLRSYPNAKIDVVEIDSQMTQIARDYFRLQDNPNLRIFHQDGRIFLNQIEEKKYDVIFIDAFNSLYSIPFHLTTIESVTQMSKGLSDDGCVVINLVSAFEGKGSLFLQAEYETLRQVFPKVYIFKINQAKDEKFTQNIVLIACKSEKITPQTPSQDAEISALLQNIYTKPLNVSVPILTDDFAPVEYYNSFAEKTVER